MVKKREPLWHWEFDFAIVSSGTSSLSSAENQKGVNAVQRCSVENQKGAISIDFVQGYRPSAQRNIVE